MGVRVLCATEHFEKVKAGLEQRGALITDAELTRQFGVVRGTAPLAALLGFPRELDEITAARAQHIMWLSHYAPVRERQAESRVA
jgi:translation elongation factor EF-G